MKRLLRFRLSTLFLAMIVIAVVLRWRIEAHNQGLYFEALKQRQCCLLPVKEPRRDLRDDRPAKDPPPVRLKDVGEVWNTPTYLGAIELKYVPNLHTLVLANAGDEDLAKLRDVQQLERLVLVNYSGSDTGLRQLARLKRLRELAISGRLGSGEFFAIGEIPALEHLWVVFDDLTLTRDRPRRATLREWLDRTDRGLPDCSIWAMDPDCYSDHFRIPARRRWTAW